ncbi:hypothetical protein WNZ14_15250 [Hoeflea sp. AS60]|uniref:hypothetical protein n=1 Tax=Hoeflea sp. AS60 TaxID=3135780 RepID=UPI00317411B9
MQAALIIMTILGCDDTATQCHFVEMLDDRWATVQACDAQSEDKLKTYSNLDYPVVVAVCQTPGDTGLSELAGEPAAPPAGSAATAESAPQASDIPVPKADIPVARTAEDAESTETAVNSGFAALVLQRFKDALPEAKDLKALVTEPVHVVTDSYSWVAQRFDK